MCGVRARQQWSGVWGLEPGGDQWDARLNLVIAAEMSDCPLAEMDACVPGDASRSLA